MASDGLRFDWRTALTVFLLYFGVAGLMLGARLLAQPDPVFWRWLLLSAAVYFASIVARTCYTGLLSETRGWGARGSARYASLRTEGGALLIFLGMTCLARIGPLDEALVGLLWMAASAALLGVVFGLRYH